MVGSPLPDCSVCRQPDFAENRVRWGCDADVPEGEEIFATSCPCGGEPECKRCKGTGLVEWRRCPNAVLSMDAEEQRSLISAMNAYVVFDAHGILPESGGWVDQSCQFAELVRIVAKERARWDTIRDKEMEKQRKQQHRRSTAATACKG